MLMAVVSVQVSRLAEPRPMESCAALAAKGCAESPGCWHLIAPPCSRSCFQAMFPLI